MPFSAISGSDIILSFIPEHGFNRFFQYISKFENVSDESNVRIRSFDEFKKAIHGTKHLFEKSDLCNTESKLDDVLNDPKKLEKYSNFCLKELPRLKKEFSGTLSDYTCHREYINRFEQTKYEKSHPLYLPDAGNWQ